MSQQSKPERVVGSGGLQKGGELFMRKLDGPVEEPLSMPTMMAPDPPAPSPPAETPSDG